MGMEHFRCINHAQWVNNDHEWNQWILIGAINKSRHAHVCVCMLWLYRSFTCASCVCIAFLYNYMLWLCFDYSLIISLINDLINNKRAHSIAHEQLSAGAEIENIHKLDSPTVFGRAWRQRVTHVDAICLGIHSNCLDRRQCMESLMRDPRCAGTFV